MRRSLCVTRCEDVETQKKRDVWRAKKMGLAEEAPNEGLESALVDSLVVVTVVVNRFSARHALRRGLRVG
jgi:hypothetical protein